MGRFNRQVAKFFGYDLVRYKKSFRFDATMTRIFRQFTFDGVIDVGANVGFFSNLCLTKLPGVPVFSFEPASDLAEALEARARFEPRWHMSRSALGDVEGTGQLHISGSKGVYNSLNAVNPAFADTIDGLTFTRDENVSISTLDRLLANEPALANCRNLLLKVDTQGHDFKVLKGGLKVLSKVRMIIVELPFQNIYDSGDTYRDILEFMEAAGFGVYSLSPISLDDTGAIIEADGFFLRR